MIDNKEKNINEDHLYILRLGDDNLFYTDYFPIDKSFLQEIGIESFFEIIDKKHDKYLSINKLKEIKKNETIKFFKKIQILNDKFMGHRDYCSGHALRSSFFEYRGLSCYENLRFSDDSYGNDILVSQSENSSYSYVKDFVEEFFQSYFIEKTYGLCNSNNSIKAFSHRKVGWHTINQKLNDIFSVDLNTNFSFGSSSYFTITIILDEIKIIPYSILVIYRYANTMQLLRNTRSFGVYDISWKHSFDFIRDACNEFLQNGKNSFISKYIYKECETLIDILPKFLTNNTFSLSENNDGNLFEPEYKTIKVKLEGYPLVVFRSEKIAGAVDFYDDIVKLDRLIKVDKYLKCILNCSTQIIPILESEANKLELDIKLMDKKIMSEEVELSRINQERLNLKEVLNGSTNEQYTSLLKSVKEQDKICSEIKKETRNYRTYHKEIDKNMIKIKSFIEIKDKNSA